MKHLMFAVVLGFATVPAWAQDPQTAAPHSPPPPLTSPSTPAVPPEKIAPPATGSAAGGTLSDRLAKDHGLVKPPAVDPAMTVHPPAKGTMPVIPPPGTPGGNPEVVPK